MYHLHRGGQSGHARHICGALTLYILTVGLGTIMDGLGVGGGVVYNRGYVTGAVYYYLRMYYDICAVAMRCCVVGMPAGKAS